MFGFIAANIGTIAAGAVVLLIVALAARRVVRQARRGSGSCDCAECACEGCGKAHARKSG
ncbi:MAG: FeoB-associated Cys-rich membrane protein [Oscillospiraceae bacterium]|jgi:hypothetical protein|nr:FeoB-associated Cys-rich membrane protein [Oscillospiraceae bacterium]